MINSILDFSQQLWRSRGARSGTKGWHTANAVCCVHNGETQDRRRRGGMLFNEDGTVSYHCFNCGFKASFKPGYHLSYKFRKLLAWMGANEGDIKRLVIEAIRVRELIGAPDDLTNNPTEQTRVEFTPRPLPADAVSFADLQKFMLSDPEYQLPDNIAKKLEYVIGRGIDLDTYDFYLSDQKTNQMANRVIVPCYWQGALIGYSARAISDTVQPKFFNQYAADYVFNMDQQSGEHKFVIVCEGLFDALSIGAVAVLNNEVSETQADIIESLGKEVIVVPDADRSGGRLVEYAIEYGWTVSFPVWQETCKDINEAVRKYGKLFTLKTILDAREHNPLKIELISKKYKNR